MRHFVGFILAGAVAAAVFFGGGWGIAHMSAVTAHSTGLPSQTGLEALAAVVGTGLFLGILMAAPAVSPLATGLPGLGLLGLTVLLALHPDRATALIPLHSMAFGVGFKSMLVTGLLGFTGAAMIFPLFVPSRWHRPLAGEEDEDEDDSVLPTISGLLS
ncbi:MAG TPA: hypothetical protein VIV12_23250 [Streptosporangiaceae bacterium]